MRAFGFIFIVYFVMLLTQPCQDMIAAFDGGNGSTSAIARVDQPLEPQHSSDDCSPLCFCSCCGLSVADRSVAKFSVTTIASFSFSALPTKYNSPVTSTFQNSIWQPPKA
ncbi:MAG: hypothetical protein ABL999_03960 [Pyrinomonadaceae bacterium]